jgi:hypothetical protein
MRRPFRGQAQLGEGDDALELNLDINALVDLQAETGMPLKLMLEQLSLADIRLFRSIIFIAARRKHRNITVEKIGEVMSDVGLEEVQAALEQLFKSVMPEKRDEETNPPKPATEAAPAPAN